MRPRDRALHAAGWSAVLALLLSAALCDVEAQFYLPPGAPAPERPVVVLDDALTAWDAPATLVSVRGPLPGGERGLEVELRPPWPDSAVAVLALLPRDACWWWVDYPQVWLSMDGLLHAALRPTPGPCVPGGPLPPIVPLMLLPGRGWTDLRWSWGGGEIETPGYEERGKP